MFASNAYASRFALSKAAAYTSYATRDGGDNAVYETCDAVHSSAASAEAAEAYKVARRAAVAAFQAYAAAYDARNARLVSTSLQSRLARYRKNRLHCPSVPPAKRPLPKPIKPPPILSTL